jgi:hypothetical protein
VSWIPSYARYSLGMPPRNGCAGDAGVCDKADGDIVVCGGALNIKNPCISTYYCSLLHYVPSGSRMCMQQTTSPAPGPFG